MLADKVKLALAASALAFGVPAGAQVVSGGTEGGVTGEDVSASTCGYGSTDGSGTSVGGCADAEARNGGTAETSTRAKANERRAMQRSDARARDDDERARSRTRTVVRNGEVVRSRTMSMYKMKGERPVREVVSTKATPEGTKTRKKPKGD
jgi:hypothetical protein